MNGPLAFSRRTFLKAGAAGAAAASLGGASVELSGRAAAPLTTRIETSHGPVQGAQTDDGLVWYSIPYGAAPVGEARWCAPASPAAWTEARDCTAPGPAAAQYTSAFFGVEDCLHLDVYSAPDAVRRPVIVYLHGGGNQTGSARELPGFDLVRRCGCVYVSVDYRLGLLGFNCLPAVCAGGTGNFGLLDICKALAWVQENIAAFGGDAGCVTLMGFSGGARDILPLLTGSMAEGLFHRAVVISGGLSSAEPAASVRQTAAALAPLAVADGRCADEATARAWLAQDDTSVRDWLCGVDASRLAACMANSGLRMSAFPHLFADGVTVPENGFSSASFRPVPLMLISSRTEFGAFALWDKWFDTDEAKALSDAERAAAKSFAVTYGSALYGRYNSEATARTVGQAAPLYLCKVACGAADSRAPIAVLGSFHGVSLPLLSTESQFKQCADFTSAGYTALAERFNAHLAAFLRTGDPNADGLPHWDAWTEASPLSLVLDADASGYSATLSDISQSEDDIFAQMDADTTLSASTKQAVIQNVLGGRFFSAGLDEHYALPSLWVEGRRSDSPNV